MQAYLLEEPSTYLLVNSISLELAATPSTASMFLALALSTALLDFSNWLVNIGIDIPTSIAIMATIINNSANVNLLFLLIMN